MSGTTAGVTSGTVLGTPFNVGRVIEHAFRRSGRSPQKASGEQLQVARDLLFLQLSEYVNYGFPLWTRQQRPLGITLGSPNVPTPYGTVDVLHVYWRILNPWRGSATLSTGLDGSVLFGGQPNTDVGISPPNPGVGVNFGASTEVDTVGVLPGYSTGWQLDGNGNPMLDGYYNPILAMPNNYTASLELLVSQDGVTWINAKTLPSTNFTAGVWSYFDLEPSISAPFMRVILPGSAAWILNQVNFGLANSTQIDLGMENIDDYYDLPNRFFQGGQPNTSYLDRKLDQPVIKIWPTPNIQAFYGGTIVSLQKRYIQDPGALTNGLEIPARWLNGVIARLAINLLDELPDPGQGETDNYFSLMTKIQRRQLMETAAAKAEAGFWSEERTKAPIRITPNIAPYTR